MRKRQMQIAKEMFKNSLTGELVDSRKVKLVLEKVVKLKVAHMTKILKIYMHLVESALKKEELLVESAAKIKHIKQFERTIMEKTGAKRIKYKINPEIVSGARITHGDWIYDASLEAKLNQLITGI